MKIALTAIVIGSLIFGALYASMGGVVKDVDRYIENNSAGG